MCKNHRLRICLLKYVDHRTQKKRSEILNSCSIVIILLWMPTWITVISMNISSCITQDFGNFVTCILRLVGVLISWASSVSCFYFKRWNWLDYVYPLPNNWLPMKIWMFESFLLVRTICVAHYNPENFWNGALATVTVTVTVTVTCNSVHGFGRKLLCCLDYVK